MPSSILDLTYHVNQLDKYVRQFVFFEKDPTECSADLGVILDSIRTLVITLSEQTFVVLEQQSEATLQQLCISCFTRLLPAVASSRNLNLKTGASGGPSAQKR